MATNNPDSTTPGRIPHLPALDGLRGVALVGVLLFHTKLDDGPVLAGGYLGVDLFFVLSGYLITALLIAEKQHHGRIDLLAFWGRRIRRLLPALLLLAVATMAYGRFFTAPQDFPALRGDVISTLLYAANWTAILGDQSYWDLFKAPSPLKHTWSLAIEEQFYLFFPPVAAWCLHAKGKADPNGENGQRRLLIVALTFALASMVLMAVLASGLLGPGAQDPSVSSRIYLGTDTRAAAILLGVAFAIVLPPTTIFSTTVTRRLDAMGVLAMITLAIAWWKVDGRHPSLYRGGIWLTEIAALVLVTCAVASRGDRPGLVGRALSLRPLRWLGKVSYGAYLWHWPIFLTLSPSRMARVANLSSTQTHLLRWAVSFAVAWLSFLLVEQPIRKHGLPFSTVKRRALAWLVAVGACLGVVAAVQPSGVQLPWLVTMDSFATPDAEPWRVLFIGDSTANTVAWSLKGLRQEGIAIEMAGENGFDLTHDGPKWAVWSELEKEAKPDATVIVLNGAFLYGMTADRGWRNACYPKWQETLEQNAAARLDDLASNAAAADGPKRVLWIATLPYAVGEYDNPKHRGYIDCVNRSIRSLVTAREDVRILDLNAIQCPRGKCTMEYQGIETRPDGVHYDLRGARGIAMSVLARLRGN